MKRTTGIYKITCLATGQVYIGASGNIESRLTCHKSDLKRGEHCNSKLQALYNKYSILAFSFDILEECDLNQEKLIALEAKYMQQFSGNSLNIRPSHKGTVGYRHEKTKQKMKENREREQREWIKALEASSLEKERRYSGILTFDYSLGI